MSKKSRTTKQPEQAQTRRVRYVFLDVVKFTHGRSVEAQLDIIERLNEIVVGVAKRQCDKADLVVFLPTGDGICIALLDEGLPYDIHMTIALEILRELQEHNDKCSDKTRRFALRVGLNENVDNVIKDINGSLNVAGSGVNMAQRIMNVGDGGQIFVGQVVWETLVCRERYMKAFKKFAVTIKHDSILPVYQFVEKGHVGLKRSAAKQFRVVRRQVVEQERTLTTFESRYLAMAILHREEITKRELRGSVSYSATIALWYKAQDEISIELAPAYETPHIKSPLSDFNEVVELLQSYHFWVICDLTHYIQSSLENLSDVIERGCVATSSAEKVLVELAPDVALKYGIARPTED